MANEQKEKKPLLFNENDPEYQKRLGERDDLKRLAGLQGSFKDILKATTGFESSGDSVNRLDKAGEQIVQDFVNRKNLFKQALEERRSQEGFDTQQQQAQQNLEQSEQLFDPKLKSAELGVQQKEQAVLETSQMLNPNTPVGKFAYNKLQQLENEAALNGKREPTEVPRNLSAKEYDKIKEYMESGEGGMTEYQKQSLGLRKKEATQRQIEEQRRRGQFARGFVKDLDQDPVFKDLKKQESAFQQIDQLKEAAADGNEVATASIGTRMARAMGEVGVLTDADVVRYLGNQSYGRKMLDWYNRGMKGQLNAPGAGEMAQVAEIMDTLVQQQIGPLYERYAGRLRENYNRFMPDDAISSEESLRMLGAPNFVADVYKEAEGKGYGPTTADREKDKTQESKQQDNGGMVKMQIPDGRIKMIPQDKVDQAIKAGAKIVE